MAECLDDLNLPTTIIARLIKDALPQGVSVTSEAKAAIARAASVFVLYLTNMSNSNANQDHRKRILPKDIFESLNGVDFDEFVTPLKEAFESYKKSQSDKKLTKKDSVTNKSDGKPTDDEQEIDDSEPTESNSSDVIPDDD